MKRFLVLLAFTALSLPALAFGYSYTFTCGPTWNNLPVPYWINSAGSADLPFSTIMTRTQESFDVWGDPCCSRFAGEYQGTTQLTALNNQGRVVLSWVEDSWNPQWGSVNQTIGITFSSVWSNCVINEAPILFNGVGFRFTDGPGGTDYASIATHEIGHLTGLGHSQLQDATMFAAYIGGTGARTLHQDDVNGICSLYTRSCSCSSSSECAADEQCTAGQCELRPCLNNSDCDVGLECNINTGDCEIPGCNTDADCAAGFTCNGGVCGSSCPVCRRNCDVNGDSSDCGSGAACSDFEGAPACYVFCDINVGVCPGDAQCYIITDNQGNRFGLCGDPDAGQTDPLCPADYVCEDDTITHNCDDASDCPAGQVCVNSTEGRRCAVPEDPCADVTCEDGFVCENGACVAEDITSNNNPGNNTPGNNTPGNNANVDPGNNSPGNNNTGANNNTGGTNGDADPMIIIFGGDDGGEDTGCCTTAKRSNTDGVVLLLVGLLFGVRRRR